MHDGLQKIPFWQTGSLSVKNPQSYRSPRFVRLCDMYYHFCTIKILVHPVSHNYIICGTQLLPEAISLDGSSIVQNQDFCFWGGSCTGFFGFLVLKVYFGVRTMCKKFHKVCSLGCDLLRVTVLRFSLSPCNAVTTVKSGLDYGILILGNIFPNFPEYFS